MIKTGLGHRIALIFVRLIGRKTIGLGYSLVFTDFLLASVIPSTGAALRRHHPADRSQRFRDIRFKAV